MANNDPGQHHSNPSQPPSTKTRLSRKEDPHQLVGRTIDGRYSVESVIGIGGMGVVYKAHQASVDRTVAIKVLMPEMVEDESLIKRFQLEARAASRLTHPNTITVYDFGRENSLLYIVMELLEGESLQTILKRGGAMSPLRAAKIISQVCASLAEAHGKGIVHRDVKPDNIFLRTVGKDKDYVKVLDFGVAKLRDPSLQDVTVTQAGMIFGTPKYMSPEQAKAKKLDGRSDIYALGIVMYECLMGRVPFLAEDPVSILIQHVHDDPPTFAEVRPDLSLPPELEQIAMRAMAKNRQDRFPSADLVKETLDAFSISYQAGVYNQHSGDQPAYNQAPSGQSSPIPTDRMGHAASHTPPPGTPPPFGPPSTPSSPPGPLPPELAAMTPPPMMADSGGFSSGPLPSHDGTWSMDPNQLDLAKSSPTQLVRIETSNTKLLVLVLFVGLILLGGVGFLIYRLAIVSPEANGENDAGPTVAADAGVIDDQEEDATVAFIDDDVASTTVPDLGMTTTNLDAVAADDVAMAQTDIATVEEIAEEVVVAVTTLVTVRIDASSRARLDFDDRVYQHDPDDDELYIFDLADGETLEFEASRSDHITEDFSVDLTDTNENGVVEVRVRLDEVEDDPGGNEDPCRDPITGLIDPYCDP